MLNPAWKNARACADTNTTGYDIWNKSILLLVVSYKIEYYLISTELYDIYYLCLKT